MNQREDYIEKWLDENQSEIKEIEFQPFEEECNRISELIITDLKESNKLLIDSETFEFCQEHRLTQGLQFELLKTVSNNVLDQYKGWRESRLSDLDKELYQTLKTEIVGSNPKNGWINKLRKLSIEEIKNSILKKYERQISEEYCDQLAEIVYQKFKVVMKRKKSNFSINRIRSTVSYRLSLQLFLLFLLVIAFIILGGILFWNYLQRGNIFGYWKSTKPEGCIQLLGLLMKLIFK